MSAFYNEIDPEKAEWLRQLIKAGVIAPGIVDERSITELEPDELEQYTQCHFFAGIGVWSYSLRLAGWPDDRPVWTGSCPCPSFSCAGKGRGFDDPRHLWPDWERLISVRRPPVIFGEQSDDAIGYGWLDLVQTQLEASDYAVGKAVLASASVGGADIRQRLYFVADSQYSERWPEYQKHTDTRGRDGFGRSSDTGLVADTEHDGCDRAQGTQAITDSYQPRLGLSDRDCSTGSMGNPGSAGLSQRERDGRIQPGTLQPSEGQAAECRGITRGFWADAEWVPCRHPKVPGAIEWRPIKPGTFCLAHGAAARVLSLRGFGDAINAQVAKAFIESYVEARGTIPGD